MRRVFQGLLFIAILSGSLATMIAIQRLVSIITQPDVLPAEASGNPK